MTASTICENCFVSSTMVSIGVGVGLDAEGIVGGGGGGGPEIVIGTATEGVEGGVGKHWST